MHVASGMGNIVYKSVRFEVISGTNSKGQFINAVC